MTTRKIKLIFTRDFDQWIQEMCRNSLVCDFPKLWGAGLSDQIVYFDGRTFGWYRYEDDMVRLKESIFKKSLSDFIFDKISHVEFINNVKKLRNELAIFSSSDMADSQKHLDNLYKLFKQIYPFYPVGIFIAGPWRDDFLKIHGNKGKKVLEILFKSREESEGLLKLVGLHLRDWLGPKIKMLGYKERLVRLLTVKEIVDLINRRPLPPLEYLLGREKGYVYFKGKIILTYDWKKFLNENNLELSKEEHVETSFCRGTVAYGRGIIQGTVQKIFNSFEVANFQPGNILVTPMTSPEYLSAMKQSEAVITDEGGITCHAAIVSRELQVPCVIGTKIATRVLKDGDKVEVNAGNGVIKKINL